MQQDEEISASAKCMKTLIPMVMIGDVIAPRIWRSPTIGDTSNILLIDPYCILFMNVHDISSSQSLAFLWSVVCLFDSANLGDLFSERKNMVGRTKPNQPCRDISIIPQIYPRLCI